MIHKWVVIIDRALVLLENERSSIARTTDLCLKVHDSFPQSGEENKLRNSELPRNVAIANEKLKPSLCICIRRLGKKEISRSIGGTSSERRNETFIFRRELFGDLPWSHFLERLA